MTWWCSVTGETGRSHRSFPTRPVLCRDEAGGGARLPEGSGARPDSPQPLPRALASFRPPRPRARRGRGERGGGERAPPSPPQPRSVLPARAAPGRKRHSRLPAARSALSASPSGALRSFPRPLGSFRGGRRRARPFPPPGGRSAFSVSARRFPCGAGRARRLLPGWRSSVGRCLPVAGLGAPVCVSDAAEV